MKERTKPFEAKALPEFLSEDFEFLYAIDPILTVGGIGLIHGKGGHGKTQWAFSLADAVSSGDAFLGQFPVRQGKVLYLQCDMPPQLFQERWKKAKQSLKRPELITVVPHTPFDILSPYNQDLLQRLLEKEEPTLVIVDTLRKIHYEDENDNAVPMQVYDALKSCMSSEMSGIIIHHDRKSMFVNKNFRKDTSKDDFESPDEFVETFRGARAWIDDCDLGVHLYKYGASNRVKMSYSKLRCAPLEPSFLSLNEESLLIEPKAPESAREWAVYIKQTNPTISKTDWVKEVLLRSDCGKTRAYDMVAQVEAEMHR